MSYVSRQSDFVMGGVAQDTILEGKLVVASTSGVLSASSLPNVRLAASGTVYPVYVAIVPPDNFVRPTNSAMYTAGYNAVVRADVNTGWGNPIDENYTFYRQGKSTLEAPALASGELVQCHRGGTYTLTSGAWIDVAGIKVNQALVKVADDGTGRFQLTTLQADAIGFVEQYDGSKNYLTVTLKQ